ncbi:MAG: D-2-hydroxyacid dehydrogenase [Clostridiales bacterium]|nr:D-2-hydroxyacid dehydrogenase [Clostridiales bacterium]
MIVVLDGLAANPGDISWAPLEKYSAVKAYDVTHPEDLIARASGCEMVITNKTPFDEKTLDQLPDLKYIGVLATGYNVVDIDACRKRGIAVTNVPEYGTYATAQMTIALLLEIADRVGLHTESVMNGEWVTAPQFSYFKAPLIELADKKIHIVGFGKIGRRVAAIASALGMKVSATPHNLVSEEETVEGYTVKMLPLEDGLASADVVTLHCPLTPETNALINEELLSLMKDGAILLNCSRGPVIDEVAVRKALDSGKLSGFGADVVSVEPMKADNPLLGAPNTFITPHIAWAPVETRIRLIQAAADNIGAYLNGERLNRVD